MKFFKSALRVWITVASLFGFLTGWAVLAHSPKPQPYVDPSRVTLGLDPVPQFSDLIGGSDGLGGPRINRTVRAFMPRFRTAGS